MKLPFNCILDKTDPLPPLGKKIEKPEQKKPEWVPVPGKPDLYQDKDGKYKYTPPEPAKMVPPVPAAPVVEEKKKEEWRDDLPPKAGWWNASKSKDKGICRYFDGENWSTISTLMGNSKAPPLKIVDSKLIHEQRTKNKVYWRPIKPSFAK